MRIINEMLTMRFPSFFFSFFLPFLPCAGIEISPLLQFYSNKVLIICSLPGFDVAGCICNSRGDWTEGQFAPIAPELQWLIGLRGNSP